MNQDITNYIKRQKSPQKNICQKIRKLIFETFPGIGEEMKWGAIVFAGDKFYIGVLKDHVNVGFAIDGLTRKEAGLFEGKGKTMRHIKIKELRDIDEKKMVKLLRLVNKKSVCKECK